MIKVLIACEESQVLTKEFRKLDIEAYSCDLLPSSGGHPEWHIQGDVFEIINQGWDLMIAHPPCTFLAVSGARWFYHPEDKSLPTSERRPHPRFPNRAIQKKEAEEFFIALANAPIPHIAIENPIGTINTTFKKPNQIVHPFQFGDEARKTTCLWLKNLPKLTPTKIVGQGEFVELKSGRKLPKWYSDALVKAKSPEERRTLRSKTFPGMAKAMAEQWVDYLINEYKLDKII